MKSLQILAILFFSTILYAADVEPNVVVMSLPDVLNKAKTLPRVGVLYNKENFIYLKVSDSYRSMLFPLLLEHLNSTEKSCLKPNDLPVGEHISLIYDNDPKEQLFPTRLIGKSFNFDVTEVQKVTFKRREPGRAYSTIWYTIAVTSPELMQLKNKYVPSAYKRVPLHISFAVARFNHNGSCYYRSLHHDNSQ